MTVSVGGAAAVADSTLVNVLAGGAIARVTRLTLAGVGAGSVGADRVAVAGLAQAFVDVHAGLAIASETGVARTRVAALCVCALCVLGARVG